MITVGWIAVVVGPLITGVSLAGLLVVQRNREPLAMLLSLVGVTITVSAVGILAASSSSPAVNIAAGLIALGGFGGGYGLVSALLGLTRRRCAHTFTPPGNPQDRALVLMVADVEAETYEPHEVTRQILEFTEAGLPEASIGVLPFFYASHKARYRAVGGRSPERTQAHALAEQVSDLLDPDLFSGPLLINCTDGSALTEAIRTATEHGYRTVVAATPYIAEPLHIDLEKRGVDAARLDPVRPVLTYARPLGDSETIARHLAGRISDMVDEPSVTGVALVVHGQPGDRERTYAAFEEHENTFANRVRMMVTGDGVDEQHVRLCWDAWRAPDVTETVRHLAALGCTRILVAPIARPFENLETLLELPAAIHQARVGDDVHVVQLPAWKDDPLIAEEIARAIEGAVREIADERGANAAESPVRDGS